jgi:chloramphenicol-sensitive protein RarD
MAWGVFIGHEPMPLGRWVGFALIWLALLIMTAGAFGRRSRDPVPGSVDRVEPESSSR